MMHIKVGNRTTNGYDQYTVEYVSHKAHVVRAKSDTYSTVLTFRWSRREEDYIAETGELLGDIINDLPPVTTEEAIDWLENHG